LGALRDNAATSQVGPFPVWPRADVLAMIPRGVFSVLDVGCSAGLLGEALKEREPTCRVLGIEKEPVLAEEARRRLDEVLPEDVERIEWGAVARRGPFDCIVFADVLEHLHDPWQVLTDAVSALAPDGSIVLSIPNIRHVSTLYWAFVRGRWPYRDMGIHDRTHIRFFALANVRDLCRTAGLAVEAVKRNYQVSRLGEYRAVRGLLCDRILDLLPVVRELFTKQYIVRACRDSGARFGRDKGV